MNRKVDEKKLLNNLFEFLGSDSGETLEELREELKEDGIDFDAAEARLKETFSKLIKKRKLRSLLFPGDYE